MRCSIALFVTASLLGFVFVARRAEATPVTIQFTGTLIAVDSNRFPLVSVGDSFSGIYVYDDSWLDVSPIPILGQYFSGTGAYGFTTQVGAYTFANVTWATGAMVTIYNACCPGNMIDGLQLQGFTNTGSQDINLYSVLNQTTTTTQLTQLLSIAPLALFDYQSTWAFNDGSSNLTGQLNSIQVVSAVPEPATLSLFVLGLAGGAVRRWRHRRPG